MMRRLSIGLVVAALALPAVRAGAAPAPIVVTWPVRGAIVSPHVRVYGSAEDFEAAFQLEVWCRGRRVSATTIHASSGTGTRDRWTAMLRLPHGDVTLVLFEVSPKDGSHIDRTKLPLHVR